MSPLRCSGILILGVVLEAVDNVLVACIRLMLKESGFQFEMIANLQRKAPTSEPPPLRSTVVRAFARGSEGRGSIPDRVTPKT